MFKKLDGKLILGIYVDDGILIGENQRELRELLEDLSSEFKVSINQTTKALR